MKRTKKEAGNGPLKNKICFQKVKQEKVGRGGGQVVSVLAFYSDDPSSNPAEIYNFSVKLLLKRTKINKKEAGVGPFFL